MYISTIALMNGALLSNVIRQSSKLKLEHDQEMAKYDAELKAIFDEARQNAEDEELIRQQLKDWIG